MSDNNTTEKLSQTEEKVIRRLMNEPSRPFTLEGYRFIFKQPAFTDKYKGRAWATRQLQSEGFGPEVEVENPDIFVYFRLFGNLNVNVHRILKKRENGTYEEYTFDAMREIDYQFLFEKFIIEEVYPQGVDLEESIVFELTKLHAAWRAGDEIENSEDIKNS